MCAQLKSVFFAFTLLFLVAKISSKFEFTNVECNSLDTKFDDFEYCFLKSVNRTYKYLSLKVNLFKTPITKVKVNAALFKRVSGYRPFMFNVTVDACRFLNNTKSNTVASYFFDFLKFMALYPDLFMMMTRINVNGALFKRFNGYRSFMYNVTVDACRFMENKNSNQLAGFFFDFIKQHSNMNHSSPFNHDLIVDKLSIDLVNHQITKVLPFPEGGYMLETHWIAYDIDRAVVKVYGTLS